MARLLRLGELTAVRVPDELEAAARDLVRAREDVRGDLMRARHRLSKLLLRHGLLWERRAWTGEHERWLRSLRFEGTLAVCFDEGYATVVQAKARRDRLDQAIAELAASPAYAEIVGRLCCLRGVSTLTALALTVELATGDASSPPASAPSSAWCRASTQAASSAARVGSPRPATATPAGCWSKRPGISGGRSARAPPSTARAGRTARPRLRRGRSGRPAAAPPLVGPRATRQAANDRRRRGCPRARRPLLEAGEDGLSQHRRARARRARRRERARSDPRQYYEQPGLGDARP